MSTKKSFADRTKQNARGVELIASALFGDAPKFHETVDGHLVREWQPLDYLKWTNDDLRAVLQNRVSVEEAEMLGGVPPSAIKYARNKGWLVPHGSTGLYFITRACALELGLPLNFKGIHGNRKIPFAVHSAPKKKG